MLPCEKHPARRVGDAEGAPDTKSGVLNEDRISNVAES
jgi:hypothetical protein